MICFYSVQPYPDIPFLMTAMSPYRASSSAANARSMASKSCAAVKDINAVVPKTLIQRGFTDLLSVHGQISAAVPCDKASNSTTLAAAFLVRGKVNPGFGIFCISNILNNRFHWQTS